MKRTLAVLFIAAAVGGFATYSALQAVQRIQTASAKMQAIVDLAAASHGTLSLDQPAQDAAQASLSTLTAGAQ